MIVECDSCQVRGTACGECVIGVLLGMPEPVAERPSGAPIVQFDAPEMRALDVLAEQGLLPRLRLVAAPARRASDEGSGTGSLYNAG